MEHSPGRCPKCGANLIKDRYERDLTYCCMVCGYVEYPSAVKAQSAFSAAALDAELLHRRHRHTEETPTP
jgi:transcription initiation factor TFIIIB Brf1 subunit/transcription initiation factor TFIIB